MLGLAGVALCVLLLSGTARAGPDGAAPRRIALERWQLARIRTGSIVECEGLIKNISDDRLDNIVVTAAFLGDGGKSLGRTPVMAVDSMGGVGKVRQGLIARLEPGGAELLSIRAPRIPIFEKYLVSVNYSVAGRSASEEFEGSPSRAPERAALDVTAVGDRLEVRIVKQSLSASVSLPGKPKKYRLELLLKNDSCMDVADLEVSLEVSAAGRLVKTVKFTLEPSVLKAGQGCVYKIDCGALPIFDSQRIVIDFKKLTALAGEKLGN